MRAMTLQHPADVGTAPLALRELPVPDPGPGEVRVRISVCGVCRTDLHIVEGDLPPGKQPVVPGHEAVGTVDWLGAAAGVDGAVEQADVKIEPRIKNQEPLGAYFHASRCGTSRMDI